MKLHVRPEAPEHGTSRIKTNIFLYPGEKTLLKMTQETGHHNSHPVQEMAWQYEGTLRQDLQSLFLTLMVLAASVTSIYSMRAITSQIRLPTHIPHPTPKPLHQHPEGRWEGSSLTLACEPQEQRKMGRTTFTSVTKHCLPDPHGPKTHP